MRFSERYGYTSVRDTVQIESMDDALRNGLWSLLKVHCWDHVQFTRGVVRSESGYFLFSPNNADHKILCERLWLHLFKRPLDNLSHEWSTVLAELREIFFACEWFEAYDLIEFVANFYQRHNFRDRFIPECNHLLEREMSAYRFVDGVITQVTEQIEIDEIEQAIETISDPVANHLKRSLELLSNRKAPDYRNSIKESISAVESLVTITLEAEKGTLGSLLHKLEKEIGLHPALKKAFSNLYGYTNDEGGIRHAQKLDSAEVDFNDAKFMIVACSAFVNYVRGKST
jgi:hypothetical protein